MESLFEATFPYSIQYPHINWDKGKSWTTHWGQKIQPTKKVSILPQCGQNNRDMTKDDRDV